jgi:guanylate kinase
MKGNIVANPSFVGRTAILRRLLDRFAFGTTSLALTEQRRFVLFGLGGCGKTQIASKFIQDAGEQ